MCNEIPQNFVFRTAEPVVWEGCAGAPPRTRSLYIFWSPIKCGWRALSTLRPGWCNIQTSREHQELVFVGEVAAGRGNSGSVAIRTAHACERSAALLRACCLHCCETAVHGIRGISWVLRGEGEGTEGGVRKQREGALNLKFNHSAYLPRGTHS